MPVWTGGEITKQALQAILDHTHRPLEIIIIDNGSDTEARAAIDDFLRLHPATARVIHNETNKGYPAACNQGLQVSQGRYQVLMNNDVLVTPYWASRMMAAFSLDAGIGAVGPRTNYVYSAQLVRDCNYTGATLNAVGRAMARNKCRNAPDHNQTDRFSDDDQAGDARPDRGLRPGIRVGQL